MVSSFDYLVVGAGSAGCVAAAELARRGAGRVAVLEAGPSERHPLVSIPFGLVWLLKSQRDWRYKTIPQQNAGARELAVPRGRMVGGSGSINSMVWFRGRCDDFDGWGVPGWNYDQVRHAFEAVEAKLRPHPLASYHPLSEGLASLFSETHPTPETESAGLFSHNMERGRRRSAADAFLREQPGIDLLQGAEIDRLMFDGDRACGVQLVDGSEVKANKGVVLSAGSINSPAILMRSGLGPKADLERMGIDARVDLPDIGQNLHDHPGVGLHFEGPGSGYGLEARQWGIWAAAPFRYLANRSGPFASPTCEAGAFFNARANSETPDVQTHFIPFFLPHQGSMYQTKAGYFADVCLSRPKSRGELRLQSKDPKAPPLIDLGLFRDETDLDTLTVGLERLRSLLKRADFGKHRAPEVFPGEQVTGDALKTHVRRNCGTAYHPVGTVRLGGPIDEKLQVRGTEGLWVADASIMPAVTSANTNAPSMMIGWKAAELIAG
ncbi:MAG: GMC family oxidoreductase N-terminal domain-containing protein [Pseudomonadota bacterium]